MAKRKVYVKVIMIQDEEGTIQPLQIVWEDGKVFDVDKVIYRCRASSTKVGGTGMRYTIRICGKETFLYYSEDENRWFVEGKA